MRSGKKNTIFFLGIFCIFSMKRTTKKQVKKKLKKNKKEKELWTELFRLVDAHFICYASI